jgi:N-acetylornithine carbamoyltransferase
MPRHLIDWHLIDDATWERLIERALHHFRATDRWSTAAAKRSIGLLFFNPSLRTRTSMELAAVQLGAHASTLNVGQGTWGFSWEKGKVMDGAEAEHIDEAVGVLSRYYDALGVRVFASLTDEKKDRDETLLHTFIQASTVPVINLESAYYHPCQSLGDAATLMTHFNGKVRRKKFALTWCYHPKALPMAVPNSALLTASRLGMDVTLACPPAYVLDKKITDLAAGYARQHGASFDIVHDQAAGCEGADIIYAKAWSGPAVYAGADQEAALRAENRDWRVTPAIMDRTNNGRFMHCLPVRRNIVVDDAVLDGPAAIHLQQAEFRLHAQKAILEYVWGLTV